MQVVYDSYSGATLGFCDGNDDIGKLYDANGNYIGEYWGGDVFDKNGMKQGSHNGIPLDSLKLLIMKSF